MPDCHGCTCIHYIYWLYCIIHTGPGILYLMLCVVSLSGHHPGRFAQLTPLLLHIMKNTGCKNYAKELVLLIYQLNSTISYQIGWRMRYFSWGQWITMPGKAKILHAIWPWNIITIQDVSMIYCLRHVSWCLWYVVIALLLSLELTGKRIALACSLSCLARPAQLVLFLVHSCQQI